MFRRALPPLAAFAVFAAAPVSRGATQSTIDFNRDIRPILSDNCFYCHGPDKKHREAKLRLDVREDALAKEAFAPGKPEESELIYRITTDDADEQMPPPESHKKLTPQQKELLKRWIAEGAPYADHWAYIPPSRPAVPATDLRNPIDAFIRAELAKKNITPSPEADARTLIRRLSLDLTGLPPTPAEVEAFAHESDGSADAYAQLVDRLLASPRYGERMAVPWLDLVRYADTVGFHGDQNVNVFPYRDWVIDAFNSNKPFDQFTREQLAGDLLPDATDATRVASAFNRLNMVTREGGAQPKEYLAKYSADRVRTVATAWLGSTMTCAECHDHKFDPFTARDFYTLAAFFADVKQWGVYADYAYTPNPDLPGWSNDHPFPPEITVASPYLKEREARIQARLAGRMESLSQRLLADPAERAKIELWRERARGFLAARPDGWRPLAPQVEVAGAKAGAKVADGFAIDGDSVRFKRRGNAKNGEKYQVVLDPGAGRWTAVRVEVVPGPREAPERVHAGNQVSGVQLSFSIRDAQGKSRAAGVYFADADVKEPRYANGFEIIGVQRGWRLNQANVEERATSVWMFQEPLSLALGEKIVVNVDGDTLAPLRFSVSPFGGIQPLALVDDAVRNAVFADAAGAEVIGSYLWSTGADTAAFAEAKQIQREVLECRGGRAQVVVTEAREPAITRVLPRGNWQDESGEVVAPAPPHFLKPELKPADGRRLTRLDLANWLVAPENPLTARVFVNRLWKQFFGNALSAQVDELGAQGEWPSHPELLDWLAVEFRESGWDVKRLVRLMVTSATYRQDSNLRQELKDTDPQNRLLASQNPRRLDAEFVRDNALAIAGLLNLDLGGPSAFPYQPADYYAQIQFPDRDYKNSTDDRQYRRGLYTHWQRTFLHPMLANFDAPSREECAAFRLMANTPQQALTLLNDPTFVEAARVFAEKLLAVGADDTQRLDAAFSQALARAPKPRERESLTAFLAKQRDYFRTNPDDAQKNLTNGLAPASANVDAAELAAWTQVCRVVLNLHETITRY
jgi:hypothetical protein